MAELALILYDVDGTLVNSQSHILTSMEAAFAKVGLPKPDDAEIMSGIGLSLPIIMRNLCPVATEAQIDALVQAYKDQFVAARGKGGANPLSPLYPGIAEHLDRVERWPHWLLGIATGKSRRGLDHLVDMHGWNKRFVTLQCADDHPSKPHPSMVLTAMSEAGVDPERTVVVGDTTYDVEMARAAGAHALGVSWGYHKPDALIQAGAVRVVGRTDQIDEALAEILGETNG